MPAKNAARLTGVRFAGSPLDHRNAEQARRRDEEPEAHRVGDGRAEGVENAAESRSADGRQLHRGRRRRDGAGEQRGGTIDGSSVCWVGASNARATPNTKTAARINSLLIQPERRGERQRGGDQRFDRLADLQHAPAVVAVGDLAGHQHEHRHRQELHEADETEVEARCR